MLLSKDGRFEIPADISEVSRKGVVNWSEDGQKPLYNLFSWHAQDDAWLSGLVVRLDRSLEARCLDSHVYFSALYFTFGGFAPSTLLVLHPGCNDLRDAADCRYAGTTMIQ
jgi:hypothetical protein